MHLSDVAGWKELTGLGEAGVAFQPQQLIVAGRGYGTALPDAAVARHVQEWE